MLEGDVIERGESFDGSSVTPSTKLVVANGGGTSQRYMWTGTCGARESQRREGR